MIKNPLLAVLRAPDLTMKVRNGTDEEWSFPAGRLTPTPNARYNLVPETFESPISLWTSPNSSLFLTSVNGDVSPGLGVMIVQPATTSSVVALGTSVAKSAPLRKAVDGSPVSHIASIYLYHQNASNLVVTFSYKVKKTDGSVVTVGTDIQSILPSVEFRFFVAGMVAFDGYPFIEIAANTTVNQHYWLSKPMIEVGTGPAPGEWFSGSSAASESLPAPVYLSGHYETTAGNGISVSDVGWLLEGDRKQWVTNPWCAVDTAGRTAVNGTGSRFTGYSLQGPACYQLTATSSLAADTVSVTLGAGVEARVQAVVVNQAAASRSVQILVDGVAKTGSFVVAAGASAELRPSFIATGAPQTVSIQWTDAANTETFLTLYFGVVTSHVGGSLRVGTGVIPDIAPDGTIKSGFTWSGTAHASTSTGAFGKSLMTLTGGTVFPFLVQQRTGAMALQFAAPAYAIYDPDYSVDPLFISVTDNTDTFTWAWLRIRNDRVIGGRGGGGGPDFPSDSLTLTTYPTAYSVQTVVFEFNRERAGVYLLENGAIASDLAFRDFAEPELSFQSATFGDLVQALMGPLIQAAWFSTPLDATLRDTLRDTAQWTTDMFDTVALNYTELHCVDVVDGGAGVVN